MRHFDPEQMVFVLVLAALMMGLIIYRIFCFF